MQTFTQLMAHTAWLGFVISIISINSAYSHSCNSYCDHNGLFKEGFSCTDSQLPYCCGGEHNRSCCHDNSLDASIFPPVNDCNDWDIHNIGTSNISERTISLAMSAIAFAIAILFCLICGIRTHCHTRRAARERARIAQDPIFGQPPFFSTDHPFAFGPPDYDSIPKDPPPAYSEIIATDNPAFLLSPADLANVNGRSTNLAGYELQLINNNREISTIETSNETPPPYTIRDTNVDMRRIESPHENQQSSDRREIINDNNATNRDSSHSTTHDAPSSLPEDVTTLENNSDSGNSEITTHISNVSQIEH